jgi:hypothetical protein
MAMIQKLVQEMEHAYHQTIVNVTQITQVVNVQSQNVIQLMAMIQMFVREMEHVFQSIIVNVNQTTLETNAQSQNVIR